MYWLCLVENRAKRSMELCDKIAGNYVLIKYSRLRKYTAIYV